MDKRNKQGQFKKGYTYRNKKPFWDKKWLYNEYIIKKKSSTDISKEQNCNRNNILFWLKKHNIKIRNLSEAQKINRIGSWKGEDNPMWNKKGELNPNFKGGITPERQIFYQSYEWKKICQRVWFRDNAICQRCKIKREEGIPFHIHHITSFCNKKLRINLDNLILLCEICHHFVHSKSNIQKRFLK